MKIEEIHKKHFQLIVVIVWMPLCRKNFATTTTKVIFYNIVFTAYS